MLFFRSLVIIFNIPNVNELSLTLEDVADIYKGNILFWNDMKLRTKNPLVELPSEPILPISRQDSDITTTIFTRVLSYFDSEWLSSYGEFDSPSFVDDVQCTNSTKWPKNSVYMYGNGAIGMVGLVNSINYSIGYSTLTSAYQYSVKFVRVKSNVDADPMFPTIENVKEAMNFSYNTKLSSTSLDFRLPNKDSNGYPMSAFLYMVLSSSYKESVDCCIVQELVGFVDFILFHLNETILTNIGYVPLIPEIKRKIKEIILPQIKCQEGFVYEQYLDSLNPTNGLERWQIAIILVSVMVAILLVIVAGNFIYEQNFNVDINRYVVNADRIRVMHGKEKSNDKANDETSMHSISHNASHSMGDEKSQDPTATHLREFMVRGVFDENKIYLDSLVCKTPQQWTSSSKRTIAKCRNVVVKNVAALLGITVINFNPFAIFEFCSKGKALHYRVGM